MDSFSVLDNTGRHSMVLDVICTCLLWWRH